MTTNSNLRRRIRPKAAVILLGVLAALPSAVKADVKLPAIFGSHMVLQRDQKDKVWGWAEPGEEVTVQIAGQSKTAKAGEDGAWQVSLDPLPAGGPHEMTVKGKNTIKFEDVLVGEVWICSGQSNMQWSVASSKDADLVIRTAKYPSIRLITVPNLGTQEPQKDFRGRWTTCRPETVPNFSAVGYFFGRQLHETLGVPIGLINDAWGGSACEAWIRRDILAADSKYAPLIAALGADREGLPASQGRVRGEGRGARRSRQGQGQTGRRAAPEPRRPDERQLPAREHL